MSRPNAPWRTAITAALLVALLAVSAHGLVPAPANAQEGCYMSRAEWEQAYRRNEQQIRESIDAFQSQVAGNARGIGSSLPSYPTGSLTEDTFGMQFRSDPWRRPHRPGAMSRQSLLAEAQALREYAARCLRAEQPQDDDDPDDEDEQEQPTEEATDDFGQPIFAEVTFDGDMPTKHVAWSDTGLAGEWRIKQIPADWWEETIPYHGETSFTMPPLPQRGPWRSEPFDYEYGVDTEWGVDGEEAFGDSGYRFKTSTIVEIVEGEGGSVSLRVHFSSEWTYIMTTEHQMPAWSGIAGPEPIVFERMAEWR